MTTCQNFSVGEALKRINEIKRLHLGFHLDSYRWRKSNLTRRGESRPSASSGHLPSSYPCSIDCEGVFTIFRRRSPESFLDATFDVFQGRILKNCETLIFFFTSMLIEIVTYFA